MGSINNPIYYPRRGQKKISGIKRKRKKHYNQTIEAIGKYKKNQEEHADSTMQ
jgi:hypothetical protein